MVPNQDNHGKGFQPKLMVCYTKTIIANTMMIKENKNKFFNSLFITLYSSQVFIKYKSVTQINNPLAEIVNYRVRKQRKTIA